MKIHPLESGASYQGADDYKDRADFVQHPPHQGEVGIDAWSDASDVTTSNKQLMRWDFSVSGHVP